MLNLPTFLGILLSAFLVHLLYKERKKIAAFYEAAQRFREAFTEEIERLESGTESIYLVLTPGIIHKHHAAMIDFRQFLRDKKRSQFEEEWQEYYDSYTKDEFSIEMMGQASKEQNELALEHINNLLSFAKPR